MSRDNTRILLRRLAVSVGLLVTITCSDSTQPEKSPVELVNMSGTLEFVTHSGIPMSDVRVRFGAQQTAPDTAGKFANQGNRNAPGLAIVTDKANNPLLMGIVPNSQEGVSFALDVRSTALSLVFMTPFVCNSDPQVAKEITAEIEALPEFEAFENLIQNRLSMMPRRC